MIITQKAMADASDSLSALFEGKKYTKIENRIKQNGGIKNLIGERETIEIYIPIFRKCKSYLGYLKDELHAISVYLFLFWRYL